MIKTFILQAVVVALVVLLAAKIIPAVRVKRTQTAVVVAAVFAVLNLLVGWLIGAVLAIVLLPAALLTFGLPYLVLGLVVNAILLWITDKLVDDFEVRGFWPLVGTAGLISVAAWLLPRVF